MLIRNNPWQILNDLNSILDVGLRPKDDTNVESSRWTPAVDIKEDMDKFIIEIDIPGVKAENIEISMENNVLTLKGAREEISNDDKQGYHRIERIKGSFYRRFTLPDTADAEQVTAKSRDGVLIVSIGKKKASKVHKITVQAEQS